MSRRAILITGYVAIAAIAIPPSVRPAPRLFWNASASVPIGLYAARPASAAGLGDLVAAPAPAPVARLMAERGYLPERVPMLKHVAALAGQTVCRQGLLVSIGGIPVAKARPRDRSGRALPAWEGCRTLRAGEVFLLNAKSADSFDGRYFGPIPARSIVAILKPLWVSAGASAPAENASNSAPPIPQPKTKEMQDDQDR